MPRKNTRSAQGSGTIRKRTVTRRGKEYTYWEARVTVGRDPGTGRQIQRSFSGQTQKEVREKMQAAAVSVNEGTYQAPAKLTVGEWLDIWLKDYLGSVKPFTVRSYSDQVRLHIKPAIGAIKLDALNAHTIQRLYNDLGKEKNGKPGLSAKSIKNVHGVLHKALQQAVMIGYLRFNPSDACTLPRIIKKEICPLDEVQSAAFLQAIKGNKYEDFFTVALFTGMREGEILGLLWECVNFDNGTVLIDKQLQHEKKKNGAYILAPLKNNKPRRITPAPWVMQLLKRRRAQQIEQRLKAGPLWQDSGFVFTNEIGEHLVVPTFSREFKKIVASIGCPDVRFHDLRHSYAVAAIRSGDDIKTVQGNLGHATAAFTLDVYGHVTDQMKEDSAQRMERYIKGVLDL